MVCKVFKHVGEQSTNHEHLTAAVYDHTHLHMSWEEAVTDVWETLFRAAPWVELLAWNRWRQKCNIIHLFCCH